MKLNCNYCLIGILVLVILYCCLGKNIFEGLDNQSVANEDTICTGQTKLENGKCIPIECAISEKWSVDKKKCEPLTAGTYKPH